MQRRNNNTNKEMKFLNYKINEVVNIMEQNVVSITF